MRLLSAFFLVLFSVGLAAEEVSVTDADGNDINIEVYPSDGNLLVVWLVDHEERRETFEKLLESVQASGVEIWRVDLLNSYFLPRSTEAQLNLPGEGVAALLRAAHQLRDKKVLLVAYDRMSLPLLRGARLWQQEAAVSRLAGAVLFYPNVFGSAPVAGTDPVLDPIVEASNIPVVIYQPELGSQRWRLAQVMQALWRAGSPAFTYLVPGTRDWFFMSDSGHGPGANDAVRAIPGKLHKFSALMDAFDKPGVVAGAVVDRHQKVQLSELVKLDGEYTAPGFSLPGLVGEVDNWKNYRGRVTLVSFWATWCPPCVEEIPSLNDLAARYRDKEFSVVSIDYRETREQLQSFVERVPVEFPVLLDEDGKISLAWKVFSFPSSFLVDRRGRIRYSANLAIDWNTRDTWQVVDTLLAE